MNTVMNTLWILILALTTIIISTVNMGQSNEIEALKLRVTILEGKK